MSEIVYVSVGSNIDRRVNLSAAIIALRNLYGKISLSPVYESAAEGFSGPDFYNLVISFRADDVHATRAELKQIELVQERRPDDARFSDRTLDLDILLFGSHIFYAQKMDIPRREIFEYAFVLRPLADLAPDLPHPIVAKTYSELWHELTRTSPVMASSVREVCFDWPSV